MASESVNVTVFVKTLSGDLIELSVNPSRGLKGVANLLTAIDSAAFPPDLTYVSFLDEDAKEITADQILTVFVQSQEFYLNRTTGEFFVSTRADQASSYLSQLSTVLTHSHINPHDLHEARWKSTDHVVIVPTHLHHYVSCNYGRIMI